jgi:hypothetical protein
LARDLQQAATSGDRVVRERAPASRAPLAGKPRPAHPERAFTKLNGMTAFVVPLLPTPLLAITDIPPACGPVAPLRWKHGHVLPGGRRSRERQGAVPG